MLPLERKIVEKEALAKVKAFMAGLPFPLEIILLAEDTSTSVLAAQALGVKVGQIAKTLVFTGHKSGEEGAQGVVVVTSGDVRVDQKKLKALVGFKPRFASGEEAFLLTGFPPGGVCPFGLKEDLQVYVDASMNRFPVVYAAAGTANSAVPVTVDQLLVATGGQLCDVCY